VHPSGHGRCQPDHLDRAVQAERSGGVRNQQRVPPPQRHVVPLAGEPALADDCDQDAESLRQTVTAAQPMGGEELVGGLRQQPLAAP
jgi:hypothetical protein